MHLKNILAVFISLLLASSLIAQNGADEIRQMLDDRDEEIKELLGPKGSTYTQEQRDELKEIINGVIDFRSMAAYALDDTFNEISSDQRERFVSLFSTIVRDQSLNRLDIYRAEVTYENISVDGSTARVETIAQLENVRTPVNYDMERQDGEWMIIDMEIDDVSTAQSYHRQFQNIIRQRGFDALMDSLERRASRSST
ncbi:ABC transporter substrate-binding protein [Rhodohalobacter sp. SW132]|uniref:MlaC/ttg2D family ABC transporter substrate-binding protein n=1 Tax=Rhodohalobacter sp. SW132 TaxID=2293433 RepID=UPI000E228C3F|nr:ABC transporter substrate-binding protein [Rhodohalobacter sp. SW132]REL33307.1 ABC transporter substrate-binding protein [Rhodohalobacter sp. SW132]